MSSFADQYGTELSIAGETALPGCARIWVSARCGVHIPAETFPRLIAALYETAGQPEPVILKRPEIDTGSETGVNLLRVSLQPGKGVNIGTANSSACIAPSVARHLASVLAAYADAAEAEPDPAEVKELALALHKDRCPDGCDEGPDSEDYATATAALKWMRDREGRPS